MSDAVPESAPLLLGAVLTGGKSRRFGSPKARATVGGRTLGARARDTLLDVVPVAVLIGGDQGLADELGIERRPDRVPGRGPGEGIATALEWARSLDLNGALVLACDLPLLTPAVLRLLLTEWDGVRAVVPESAGPLGFEPLAAAYPVQTLGALDRALAAGVRSMEELAAGLPVRKVARSRVSRIGDPDVLFLNVNRPEDLKRAERSLSLHGA